MIPDPPEQPRTHRVRLLTLAGIERVLGDLEAPAPLGGIDTGKRRLAGYAGLLLLVAAGLLLGLAERARRDW
jgi:hypothetical protein